MLTCLYISHDFINPNLCNWTPVQCTNPLPQYIVNVYIFGIPRQYFLRHDTPHPTPLVYILQAHITAHALRTFTHSLSLNSSHDFISCLYSRIYYLYSSTSRKS